MLVEDYCQQFAAHGGGGLAFGADGNLYATGSDGSTAQFWDYGQAGTPANPCGDPPGGVGANLTPPTSEGGRLRAQDLRTTGDPAGLDGSLIRINPSTGAAASGNPLAANTDPNAKRILAYGLRDATNLAIRPGTNDVWLADRGGGYFEEINRVSSASTVRNFGWPCYEGTNIRQRSDEQDLNICEGLYAAGNADTDPYWAYDHELPVHPDENCEQDVNGSPPGSTLSGLAFYPAAGGTFPPMYRNALFFADRLRSCIWALLPGTRRAAQEGQRDPVRRAWRMRATDLEVTPEGDLLYIDQRNDVVQRISYLVANQAPTAVATATPVSGVTPLAVTFSGLGSTDPDAGDVLTYAWDLDGDNLLDDSTLAQPTFTYETPGHLHGHAPGDRHPRRDRSGHGDGHRDRQRPAHAAVRPDRGLSCRGGQLGHQLRHRRRSCARTAIPRWRASCASTSPASPARCRARSCASAPSPTVPPTARLSTRPQAAGRRRA